MKKIVSIILLIGNLFPTILLSNTITVTNERHLKIANIHENIAIQHEIIAREHKKAAMNHRAAALAYQQKNDQKSTHYSLKAQENASYIKNNLEKIHQDSQQAINETININEN